MPAWLKSRWLVALAAFSVPCQATVGELCQQEGAPLWRLLAAAGALLLAWAGGLFYARRARLASFPSAGLLWRLLGLAVLVDLSCNLSALTALWQLPLSCCMTAGALCLLWFLLGRWSLLLWGPFLLLELAQQAGYWQYGARINSLVLAETFEASGEEARAYLTTGNICILLAAVGAVLFLGWLQLRLFPLFSRLQLWMCGTLACAVSLMAGAAIPESRQSEVYYWPASEWSSLYGACSEALHANVATIALAEGLTSPAQEPHSAPYIHPGQGIVLVVHIGESIRSDRMSLNGYEKDTTPWLRKQKELVNFPRCISAACDTCQAEIAILTDGRRNIHDKTPGMQPETGSVLDLFDASGFQVYSFFGRRCAQQLKYDRVVRVLTRCSRERFNAPGSPWTSVPQMGEVLRLHPKDNLLFFINNEGSHTPFSHYDTENPPFTPAGDNFENPSSHAEEVNNAYDNTIHYTDEFVRRVVKRLRGRPFVYLYISDHGEYLGHDGIWGRGGLGNSRRHYHDTTGCQVGMFVLASSEWAELHPHFAQALGQLRENRYFTVGQEHIFHTLLGMFGIRSPHYEESLDLSSPRVQPYEGPGSQLQVDESNE